MPVSAAAQVAGYASYGTSYASYANTGYANTAYLDSTAYSDYAKGSPAESFPESLPISDGAAGNSSEFSAQSCSSDYPYLCGGLCWKCASSSDSFTCYNDQAKCCPSSYPNYCGKNDLCWTGSWMCDNSIFCNGQWWACTTSGYVPSCVNSQVYCCPSNAPYYWNNQCQACPQDEPNKCGSTCYSNNYCGSGTATCENSNLVCHYCPNNDPYYCIRTGSCWLNKERCDTAISCGGQWWACNDPAYNAKCVDGKAGCCPSGYPYFCPSTNTCFKQDGLCDGRPVYDCSGTLWVCLTKDTVGTCYGSELRCCPAGYPYWWASDGQCHASQWQQKTCTVPDGSSAQCDCDSNTDCPASQPYCEANYTAPVNDGVGYDRCLASLPEYCGNGNCAGTENYNSCPQDCSQYAPKGTVSVDVTYSSGANINKPISGAYVYLDGVQQGTTDSSGKKGFEASYGNREVKVNCPDSSLCGTKTVNVDGAKYVPFGCGCNQPGDSDNDGYSDEDERLLGTDSKDANSNFVTTFGSDSVDLLACVPTPASFFILWKEYKKSGSIIQSHSLVVNALNVTSVMSTSFEEKPYVVAQALAAAGFEAEGAEVIVNPVNVTLENVMKKAEYVDGVRMQDGILLIATDKDGQTTALIAIGAGCVGAFSGAVYGIGQGLFDDIKGVIDGIWFVITHLDDVKKVWSGAVELVSGIKELFSKPGEAFWSMFTGILKKGQGINLFGEGRINNPEAYRHFQVGFVYGFVTGYLVEQVALGAVIFSKVAKFFKLGQLFGKTGKVVKLLEKLEIVKGAEEFGAEIAEKLSKLKYLKEGIEGWLDSEIKGLARIMKYEESWLKGLSESEAKFAARRVDALITAKGIADANIADLLKTKLGKYTLTAADATDDLLAKQSKIVAEWTVKRTDDIVSKNWWEFWKPDRIKDFNKLLNELPESSVTKFNDNYAFDILSSKDFSATVDAMRSVKNVKGYDIVTDNMVSQSAWWGHASTLRRTQKLKQAGKEIVEFERGGLKNKAGNEFAADIVYKDAGSNIEKFAENKNRRWDSFKGQVRQEEIKGLADQIQNYDDAIADWDRVKLFSDYPLPADFVTELEKRFGKTAVNKLLGG